MYTMYGAPLRVSTRRSWPSTVIGEPQVGQMVYIFLMHATVCLVILSAKHRSFPAHYKYSTDRSGQVHLIQAELHVSYAWRFMHDS